MQVKLIGIDLAKNVFQVCGVNQTGKVVFNRQRTREKFLAELRKYPEVPVVMVPATALTTGAEPCRPWGMMFS